MEWLYFIDWKGIAPIFVFLGGAVALLYFLRRDLKDLLNNRGLLRSQIPPLSLGFVALLISSGMLLIVNSVGGMSTPLAIFFGGCIVASAGIFLPHLLIPKGQKNWNLMSPWVRHVSIAIWLIGISPVLYFAVIAIYTRLT